MLNTTNELLPNWHYNVGMAMVEIKTPGPGLMLCVSCVASSKGSPHSVQRGLKPTLLIFIPPLISNHTFYKNKHTHPFADHVFQK